MNAHQNLRLHEWIVIGKQSGKIREARTVVLPLIADVAQGHMPEEKALDFMEQVINFGTEGSRETQSLS
jgi:hypothetical protein